MDSKGKPNKDQFANLELRKAVTDYLTLYVSSFGKKRTTKNYDEIIVKNGNIQYMLNP